MEIEAIRKSVDGKGKTKTVRVNVATGRGDQNLLMHEAISESTKIGDRFLGEFRGKPVRYTITDIKP